MRVMTVRQPWAWAIIHGHKDVENRIRNIAGDYRGPVAIHAAKSGDYGALSDPELAAAVQRHSEVTGEQWRYEDLPRGVILGVVTLTRVHSTAVHNSEGCTRTGQRTGLCSEWARHGHHHLELSTPRALTEPIPYTGALGMRRLTPAMIDQIRTALTNQQEGTRNHV
ncbi:ASCH domain-containing protein [Leucobacter sp. cx-42]|nr:ASCH domain-containing protein [Leucobacter sp. cx-42]